MKEVKNIGKFAGALKTKMIGELVETRDILKKLAKIGIDYARGFIVERSLPIEKIKYRADDVQ